MKRGRRRRGKGGWRERGVGEVEGDKGGGAAGRGEEEGVAGGERRGGV